MLPITRFFFKFLRILFLLIPLNFLFSQQGDPNQFQARRDTWFFPVIDTVWDLGLFYGPGIDIYANNSVAPTIINGSLGLCFKKRGEVRGYLHELLLSGGGKLGSESVYLKPAELLASFNLFFYRGVPIRQVNSKGYFSGIQLGIGRVVDNTSTPTQIKNYFKVGLQGGYEIYLLPPSLSMKLKIAASGERDIGETTIRFGVGLTINLVGYFHTF